MARTLVAFAVLCAVAATIGAGYGTARADENSPWVASPPPPLQYEAVPAMPGPAYVWVAGHWQWAGRWVWIPGRWQYPPYRGARWVPGRWVRGAYGWVWVAGYWAGGGPGYAVVAVSPPCGSRDIGVGRARVGSGCGDFGCGVHGPAPFGCRADG